MIREPSDRRGSVDFHPETGSYTADFDGDSTAPSRAILDVMAHVTGADHVDLDPLYDSIDPSALDAICGARRDRSRCLVQFAYDGHRVTVERDGKIEVEPLSAEE